MKPIEISPIEVLALALSTLPPEAVIFDPATRSHEHCCVVCSEPLEPCQCDLSNRIEYCPECYRMVEEDLRAIREEEGKS